MPELTLPVAMRYHEDGDDEFVYRTFSSDEIETVVAPFRAMMEAEGESADVACN